MQTANLNPGHCNWETAVLPGAPLDSSTEEMSLGCNGSKRMTLLLSFAIYFDFLTEIIRNYICKCNTFFLQKMHY